MRPKLVLIAGPNGAGKTQFFQFFKSAGIIDVNPVNIDALEKDINEDNLPFDPMRYERVRRKEIDRIFTESCESAIRLKLNYAYECNLRIDQVKNVALFDEANYKLALIYIWLDSVEISKFRVKKRHNEGGHFVGDESIDYNFKEGLKNLNESFLDWDELYIFNNSIDIVDDTSVSFQFMLYMNNKEVRKVFEPFFRQEIVMAKLPDISKYIIHSDCNI
jgi:predicted ABC-type ATPase